MLNQKQLLLRDPSHTDKVVLWKEEKNRETQVLATSVSLTNCLALSNSLNLSSYFNGE